MTKLERAKRFLNQTARPGLRVLSLALLAGSAYATTCTIGSGTTFNVTGLFDDGGLSSFGSTLSGTLDIDTTGCGDVLSGNLVVTPNPAPATTPLNFTSISSQGLVNSSGYYYYVDFTPVDSYSLDVDIYLSSPTLDGYTGGNLCSDNQSCGGAETFYGVDPNLSSGSLSPASGAPEPSSALLLFGGAAALIGLRQRKRRA